MDAEHAERQFLNKIWSISAAAYDPVSTCNSNRFLTSCMCGSQITGKCFDIICPANMECYEHGDWFNVEPYLPKSRSPHTDSHGMAQAVLW